MYASLDNMSFILNRPRATSIVVHDLKMFMLKEALKLEQAVNHNLLNCVLQLFIIATLYYSKFYLL